MAKEQDVRMRLRFDDSEADRGLNNLANKFSKSFTNINAGVALAQKGFELLQVAVGAVASAMGEAAAESNRFAAATREVMTIANQAELPLGKVEKLSRQLAVTYGTAPVDQAKALYQAISAGAKDAASTVDTANKLAIAGLADVEQTIDVLTTVTNSWSESNLSAERASDILFATVKKGKTRIDELASSFGTVAPIAAALGVSMEEVGAAVATMTLRGASTSEAFTQLRSILAGLTRNTQASKKAAKDLHIEFSTTALRTKGLGRFIKDVTKAAAGNEAALQKLFGRIEAVTGALALGADGTKQFQEALDATRKSGGLTEEALEKVSKTMNHQVKRWEAVKTVAMGALGDSITESDHLRGKLDDVIVVLDGITKEYLKQDEITGKSKLAKHLDEVLEKQEDSREELISWNTLIENVPVFHLYLGGLSLLARGFNYVSNKISETAKAYRGAVSDVQKHTPKFKTTWGRDSWMDFVIPDSVAVPGSPQKKPKPDDDKEKKKRKKNLSNRQFVEFMRGWGTAAEGKESGTAMALRTEAKLMPDEDWDAATWDAGEAQEKRNKKEADKEIKAAEKRAKALEKVEKKNQRRREKQWIRHTNAMANIASSGIASLVEELVVGAVKGELDVGQAMRGFFGGLLSDVGKYWIKLGAAQIAFAAASAFAPGTWAVTGGPGGGAAAGAGMIAAGAALVGIGALVKGKGSGGADPMASRLGNTEGGGRGPGRVYGSPNTSERRDAQVPINAGLGPQNTLVNVSISSVLPGSEARIGRELVKILDRTNALQVQRA
jgi:TP901 family phage tail tape measure protein